MMDRNAIIAQMVHFENSSQNPISRTFSIDKMSAARVESNMSGPWLLANWILVRIECRRGDERESDMTVPSKPGLNLNMDIAASEVGDDWITTLMHSFSYRCRLMASSYGCCNVRSSRPSLNPV